MYADTGRVVPKYLYKSFTKQAQNSDASYSLLKVQTVAASHEEQCPVHALHDFPETKNAVTIYEGDSFL